MKLVQHIVALCFLPSLVFAQKSQPILVSEHFNNLPFVEFVNQMEAKYDLRFYYRVEWIDSITVSIDANLLTVDQFVEKVIFNTKLDHIFNPPKTIILLPSKRLVKNIPDYRQDVVNRSEAQENKQISRSSEYIEGRRPDVENVILIGEKSLSKKSKNVTISGRIVNANDGEPIVGATMYIPDIKKGAATDINGFLDISLKPGNYMVIFQSVGMKEVEYNIQVYSNGSFTLSMEEDLLALDEIIVRAQEDEKRGNRLGIESVTVETIKELPSLMGEKDVLKIAQLLPGIVSVGEGSAGLNVRGGNADQNMFYLNNVPIYNSSHLFGFFSSVNTGVVERFFIYKGQVPAEYGGRLSSVFNVETRPGHKNKVFSQGGVSPISASAEVEIPLVKEKLAVVFSGRSSYSDWMLKRLDDPDLRNSSASFYDLTGSLNYELSKKTSLNIFGYNSNDSFNLNGYTEYKYGNLGFSTTLKHRFSDRIRADFSVVGSHYNFETVEKRKPSEAYSHDYQLKHYETKTSLSWILGEKHSFKLGFTGIKYDLERGQVRPYQKESMKMGVDLGKENGIETAFFLDDNIALSPRMNLYLGIRHSSFYELGDKMVREYAPNAPVTDNSVIRTIDYESQEKISSYGNPEFRVGFDYKLTQNSSIKLSANQMTQYLFMLSNTISIAPNDQWKLVDSHIRPPKSIQYSCGYFYRNNLGNSLTAEVYYKQAKDVVEYKDGANFLSTPFVETSVLQGDQHAYGVELMFARDIGRVNGWASYTYSRSYMTVDSESDWGDINYGKKYPSNFDKPHVVNVVTNYKLNYRLSLSSNFVYNTGRPITMPVSVYYVDGAPYVNYSERNARRIPDYMRMDLSLKIEGNLKSKKPMHSYWMVSVYNLFGRKNANSVFFTSEEGSLRGYKYSIIGVPIVSISWNWKLGNYANE